MFGTMNLKLKFFVFILFVSFFVSAKGQVYPFRNLTVEDGLSQSTLLSIEQDREGVIWIGTNNGGITKYNGTSFDYLTVKDSLPDNIIYCIKKDQMGRLWIGTNNGLSIYDGKTFKNYTTEDGLTHNRIYHILFDQNQTAWIGTGKGVSVFKEGKIEPFNTFENLNQALVIHTYEDKKGTLWFSTLSHGLFSLSNNKLDHITEENGLASKYVYSVNEDAKGVLHVFAHKGLYRFINNELTELSPMYFKKAVSYYGSEIDQFGNLWIASSRGVFKSKEGSFQHFTTENGLIDNDIWKIKKDSENNLWFISKATGLSMLMSERFFKYSPKGLPNHNISSLNKTENGDLWIGTEAGVVIDKGGSTQILNEKSGLPSDIILSILEDGNRTWLGTDFGISYIENGLITNVEITGSNNSKKCFKIFKDKSGQIWFGTFNGLSLLSEGKIVPYKPHLFMSNTIFDICEDADGVYWYGTDEGLISYNGTSVTKYGEGNGIKKGRVRTVISKENNLWIGSSSGLYHFDGKIFTHYAVEDGLISENIHSLIFDQKGNLWTGLSEGVAKATIKNNQVISFQNYGTAEGFLGVTCYLNSVEKSDSTLLYFGTDNGLMVYQEAYDIPNLTESKTKIIDIKLFSQATDWKMHADSVSPNNLPYDLALAYDKNYFEFNFIGVSHTNSSKIRYQYKLIGIDKDWVDPTSKNQIIYSNLPHGDYEFLVKSSNGDGIWNKTPISFKFLIHPPFWLTWWFFSGCILIIISGIYSYFRIRAANKQILDKNKIIEEINKNILDSINYAKRIQKAILPPAKLVKEYLPNSFVFYQPKDLVSGDFYWMESVVPTTQNNIKKILFAAADCTGHGVPGAMVSVVCNNALNRSVREYGLTDPGQILDKTREIVIQEFEQSEEEVKDGMDIALCSLEGNKLEYAGAHNPLWIIRNGALLETKANKQPIGQFDHQKPYVTHRFDLEAGDSIYIFSDGYVDQFGGEKGKKFKTKAFRTLLLSIQEKTIEEQKTILSEAFETWKGDLEQIDDVCVIGVKIG
jgi:ligand-binding sensor domain-containing protein/serine phosphatase RsbU (regulator of sigma subunit)